jgi:hypothetical protein
MAFLCMEGIGLCCSVFLGKGMPLVDGFWSLTFVGGVYIFMLGIYWCNRNVYRLRKD